MGIVALALKSGGGARDIEERRSGHSGPARAEMQRRAGMKGGTKRRIMTSRASLPTASPRAAPDEAAMRAGEGAESAVT